jgi:hypothetical protein
MRLDDCRRPFDIGDQGTTDVVINECVPLFVVMEHQITLLQ